ncbi:unnamed protein product [Alopecurus aequalis]
MDLGACEIERLPEELLAHVISLTSPAVGSCAAAVSSAFRAAADSDTVWSCFLPRDLPLFAKKELPVKPMSTKGLFLRLADQPALLPHKFIVVAVFSCLRRFEIRDKLDRKMLSHNTTYAVYIVFKIAIYEFDGWDIQLDEASVTVGGHELTRRVCLGAYTQVPPRHVLLKSALREEYCKISDLPEDVVVSRRRTDGWMELELGEFYNREDADGEVLMSLRRHCEDKVIPWMRPKTKIL